MENLELYHFAIIIIGSALAGGINTLAGSGSAITLTILTELLQLPGNIANGTNRVGIIFAGFASTYAFHRNGKLDVQSNKLPIFFITVGAIVGVIAATQVSNEQFKEVFRFMMVAMLFVILIKPKRWLQKTDPNKKVNLWLAIPLYIALGFYGGFIQMGMGVLFLIIMVLVANYNIMDANVVKAFVVALYTIAAVAIFHWQGLIDWRIGMLLAVGQTVGGWGTAHYASQYPKADIWAYRVLIAVVIWAILRMFGVFEFLF